MTLNDVFGILGSNMKRNLVLPQPSSTATVAPTRNPIVRFEYPDSETNHMRVRYVRVVEANADYIKGYELDNPQSAKDGKYKQYSRTRIASNGVALITF